MRPPPKPWLPDGATDPAHVAGLLEGALADWSRRWLKSEQAGAAPSFQDDWPGSGPAKWRSIPGAASVALPSNAQTAIASAMLGCAIPPSSIQANDRTILEGLAVTAIDDLLMRLASLIGTTASKPIDEPINLDDSQTWEVSFRSGKRAFKLALTKEAQVRIVKAHLAPAAKPRLAKVDRALGKQDIGVSAELGRSTITLSDLRELGTGDVIVLDRLAKDCVDLLIDGSGSPFKGVLECIEGRGVVILENFKDKRHG